MAIGLVQPNITMKWYVDAAWRFVKGILHTKMENAGKRVAVKGVSGIHLRTFEDEFTHPR
jgi:hypothetical protein